MPNSFDTSFIPQQPLLKVEGFERREERMNLALVLALVTFFVVLTVGGGVYFYHKKVLDEVHALALDLENKEKLLDIDEISRFKEVDLRIGLAKTLLQGHTVFTVLLDFLESGTIHNVGLTTLGYAYGEKGAVLSVTANAPSYEAVYFQAETWRAMKPIIEKVEISNLILAQETGVVTFAAKISINRTFVQYVQFLKDREARAIVGGSTALSASGTPTRINTSTP